MSERTKKPASAQIKPDDKKVIRWIEISVAVILLLILITLHFILLRHSGALWRDEVNSVNLVNLSSMVDFWEKFQSESFPILWFLLLRAWIFIGFGGTDLALRAFGLIIGLGALSALWYAGRILGTRLPVISLVLFAMTPVAFVGDSIRAYGLGVMLILLALATMWRVIQDLTPGRMIVCAIVVILNVHCLYHNSFLIFAICIGAAAVGYYRRDWKMMVFPLGTGLLAAISLLPYLKIISIVRDCHMTRILPVSLSWILGKFRLAIDPSGMLLTWVWFVLALLTVISFVKLLITSPRERSGGQKDLAVFLLTTMLISIIAYIAFIKILAYPTQSWYYLPLMAVLIVIIDRGIETICQISMTGRIIRIVCILGVAIFVFMDSWNAAHTRKTNMDVLAVKLEVLSAKDDLIVVWPFYLGISFARYYKGSSEWVTLPKIADNSVQRYDLFKLKMMETEPIKDVLQKMVRTLQNEHRVWFVGEVDFLSAGERPGMLPPAPHSPYGWSGAVYQRVWSDTAAFTLQTHGQTFKAIEIPVVDPVNKFENVPLMVVQGWRP